MTRQMMIMAKESCTIFNIPRYPYFSATSCCLPLRTISQQKEEDEEGIESILEIPYKHPGTHDHVPFPYLKMCNNKQNVPVLVDRTLKNRNQEQQSIRSSSSSSTRSLT